MPGNFVIDRILIKEGSSYNIIDAIMAWNSTSAHFADFLSYVDKKTSNDTR